MLVYFIFYFSAIVLVSSAALYPSFKCPEGWSWLEWDDSCSAIWPKEGVTYNQTINRALSVPMNFKLSTEFCERHDAYLPIIRDLGTQLDFYKDLMGRTSGRSFWINVWSDERLKNFDSTTNANWLTINRRPNGFVFDWDTQRSMPRSYDRCVALHMKGASLSVHGGNEKMIGTDCGLTHHVICTKKRVPVGIGAINGGEPRRMEFVWNTSDLVLTFHGSRIPVGTRLSFQTADGIDNKDLYRSPTNCVGISNIGGDSAPFDLNITNVSATVDPVFGETFCGGVGSSTCDIATVLIPKTWPFIRGAKYSLCFYVADLFPTPSSSLLEYENNLLGQRMVLDVVQKYTSFQEDICEQRANNIASFFKGYADVGQPRNVLVPFDSAVEESKDSLLSFETLNPPQGYDFLL